MSYRYGWCALAPEIPTLIGARTLLDTIIITGDSGEVPATVNVCVIHWMIFIIPGCETLDLFLPVITNEPLAPELKVYRDFVREFWKWYDTDTRYLYRSNHVKTSI